MSSDFHFQRMHYSAVFCEFIVFGDGAITPCSVLEMCKWRRFIYFRVLQSVLCLFILILTIMADVWKVWDVILSDKCRCSFRTLYETK